MFNRRVTNQPGHDIYPLYIWGARKEANIMPSEEELAEKLKELRQLSFR